MKEAEYSAEWKQNKRSYLMGVADALYHMEFLFAHGCFSKCACRNSGNDKSHFKLHYVFTSFGVLFQYPVQILPYCSCRVA